MMKFIALAILALVLLGGTAATVVLDTQAATQAAMTDCGGLLIKCRLYFPGMS